MERDYDKLTPAQKAKYTRLYNKINNQRSASYHLQYLAYSEKSEALYKEANLEAEKIRDEAKIKVDLLKAEITKINEDTKEKVNPIYEAVRLEYKPEWDTYLKASDLADKWMEKEWAEAKENFWKEVEA
jgi:hypothetical protein